MRYPHFIRPLFELLLIVTFASTSLGDVNDNLLAGIKQEKKSSIATLGSVADDAIDKIKEACDDLDNGGDARAAANKGAQAVRDFVVNAHQARESAVFFLDNILRAAVDAGISTADLVKAVKKIGKLNAALVEETQDRAKAVDKAFAKLIKKLVKKNVAVLRTPVRPKPVEAVIDDELGLKAFTPTGIETAVIVYEEGDAIADVFMAGTGTLGELAEVHAEAGGAPQATFVAPGAFGSFFVDFQVNIAQLVNRVRLSITCDGCVTDVVTVLDN